MVETLAPTGFSQDAFDAFLDSRDEPQWVNDQRRRAWDTFCQIEWPQRSEEEWMRTDIRLFKLDRFGVPIDPLSEVELPAPLLTEGVTLGGYSTAVNSRTVQSHFEPKWLEQGVLFGSLERLIATHGDLIRPHLSTVIDPQFDKFSALNGACWSGGSVLYVPRGVVVDEPFHAFSVIADGGVDFGRTLVILEDGAQATLLNEMASAGNDGLGSTIGGLHCGAIELIVGNNARLVYVDLQNWDTSVWHFAHQKALVESDASLQWTIGALGSRLAKVNQHVGLTGAGAECQVNGAMFTEGRQHLSYHTLQHHVAPSCRSDFLYKAALQDRSRTVWRGMIKVDTVAQKTDGYQRNDNLLLSSKCRADAIPGLEIEADDVRCTHGSTTSRVDDEQLFYAQTRGFSRKEAVRMIVTGFFQQIFDRIAIESVRESLGHAIARRVREYD